MHVYLRLVTYYVSIYKKVITSYVMYVVLYTSMQKHQIGHGG